MTDGTLKRNLNLVFSFRVLVGYSKEDFPRVVVQSVSSQFHVSCYKGLVVHIIGVKGPLLYRFIYALDYIETDPQ